MLRTVFMGTPDFAVASLEATHRASNLVAVYCQPDRPKGRGQAMAMPPVKQKALELGLPVFQPGRLSEPGEFERLQELKPDLIVVVAFGQILRKNVLGLPRLGCINVHSSLLPRWRGAAPMQWAILEGDNVTGVTTMKLVEKLDAGDILLQARTPISADDTAGTVHDRLAGIGAGLLVETIRGLADGTLEGVSQDEALVTYASKLSKEMEWIDPSEPVARIDRRIRALNPWPGTSLRLEDGQRLKVKSARPRADVNGARGVIFEKSGEVFLGAEGGAVQLLQVQAEGKKPVDAAGFINGIKGRGLAFPLKVLPPAPDAG